eukprot:1346834-Pyramimonas_sp.AAC.2
MQLRPEHPRGTGPGGQAGPGRLLDADAAPAGAAARAGARARRGPGGAGICSLPFRDWRPTEAYARLPSVIGLFAGLWGTVRV